MDTRKIIAKLIAYTALADKDLEDLREQLNYIENLEENQELMRDLFWNIDQDRDSKISEGEVK